MKTYEIMYDDKAVGSADVAVEGLYYKITCRCNPINPALYRVYATTETANVYLGICVPAESCYTLMKRLPKNQLPGDNIRFYISEKNVFDNSKRYPIDEGQPFEHIGKLEKAHTELWDNKLYIVISELVDQP